MDHVPFDHWSTQTFIAALRHDRLDASWAIDGPMNREVFDLYVKTQLAPALPLWWAVGHLQRRGMLQLLQGRRI